MPEQFRPLSIGVIGGSISGCLTARLLLDQGHDVHVYERSSSGLVGRGGGVATSQQVIGRLIEHGLIEDNFPTVPHTHLFFGKRANGFEDIGRCPWRPELDMECVHWSGLFKSLRAGIDDDRYHLDREVMNVSDNEMGAGKTLHFANGLATIVDLVIFTDGFRSLGRRLMYPDVSLDYRGFAVWRGVLDEAKSSVPAEALVDHPRLSLLSMPGSFVTYLMPSEDGSIKPGERVINWAVYLPVTPDQLPQMMTDNTGKQRQGTLPAGAFPLLQENKLKALMQEQLPRVYASIIQMSVDTQFQPIRVSEVPAHYDNGMCLVGDAAVAIQPLTGSGVYKALENARTLVSALNYSHTKTADNTSENRLEKALIEWSDGQIEMDKRLLEAGYGLEQAFIWNTIDLATADDLQVRQWWQKSVRFPPDYSYLKVGVYE